MVAEEECKSKVLWYAITGNHINTAHARDKRMGTSGMGQGEVPFGLTHPSGLDAGWGPMPAH